MNDLLIIGGAVAGIAVAFMVGAVRARMRAAVILSLLARSSVPLQATDVATATDLHLQSVYTILRWLEADGLVTSEERPSGPERGYRPRRFYAITFAGRILATTTTKGT